MKSIIKIGLGICFGFILLIGGCTALVGGALSASSDEADKTYAERKTEERAKVSSEEGPDLDMETEDPAPTKKPKPKPAMTPNQENALASAEDYLSYTAFSFPGLVEQLEFEGYSNADATWAVNHVTVDWKEQAAKSAKDYLSYTSFSRQGLIDQLVFEGFSVETATYGVNQTGLK